METFLWIALAIVLVLALTLLNLVRRSYRSKGVAEQAAPAQGRFLDLPTSRLHYVEKGPSSGTPVVMLHGNGGTARHFTHSLFDALPADMRAIAIDRPGSGYSTPRADGDARLGAQAATIAAAIEKLGLEKPVLVGHSFGGSLALRIALEHPGLVRALVLLAPATIPFTPKPPIGGDAIENAFARKAVAWTVAVPAAAKAGEKMAAAVFAPHPVPEDFAIEGGGVLTLRPGQIVAMLTDTAVLQPGLRAQQDRYGELTLPITVLFGDTDAILDPEAHIDALRAAAPQTVAQRVSGAGHMLPITAPQEVAAAIRAAAAGA